MTATAKVYRRRLRIAQRIVKGWPRPFALGRLYRVPYRLLVPCTGKPLIHKGRKP